MYDSDPFAAAKMVKERQAKATKRKEESNETGNNKVRDSSPVSKEYMNAPEVKMSSVLRELVEEAIKKVCNTLECQYLSLLTRFADYIASSRSGEYCPTRYQR
jgi:hypothetical protein